MSGAGGIETAQLQPNDANEADQRKAAVTCADYICRTVNSRAELLELLRELGLAHDPWALDRDPFHENKVGKPRGPQQ